MKASELRIGNIVNEGIVFGTIGNTIHIEGKSNTFFENEIDPIPISEEWLLKFGFEKVYISKFRTKYDYVLDYSFGFDFNHGFANISDGPSFRGDIYTNILHIHQLQNFYYGITGKELTLTNI